MKRIYFSQVKDGLSIRSKIFLALFLANAVAVSTATLLFHYVAQQAFTDYILAIDTALLNNSAKVVETYYAKHKSWDGLQKRRAWRDLLIKNTQKVRKQLPSQPAEARLQIQQNPQLGRRLVARTILLDKHKNHLEGRRRAHLPELLEPIKHEQKIVGYIGIHPMQVLNNVSTETRFLDTQKTTLFVVALPTLLISALIAWLLARQLIKPIQSLRRSSNELAQGNYASRIQVQNNDELGQLSQDFNKMASSLQQHEQSRLQWIMDLAHELRTPLAVLRGEIEAIQDGISQPDPDSIQSLHQETLHLQRLVDDLYTLSMSDEISFSYNKATLDLKKLLHETLLQFEPEIRASNLRLQQDIVPRPIMINGDRQRLQQLLQNLLKNSLRYTDAPGVLHVSLHTVTNIVNSRQVQNILLEIADSTPGVPDSAMPHLFERLYRVESSRNRATGGAGIGLSICHNIVQAHSGQIQAGNSSHGGLRITVILPLQTIL